MLARQKFLVVAIGTGAYFVNQRWLAAQAEEKRAVFDLIEKITGNSFVIVFLLNPKLLVGKESVNLKVRQLFHISSGNMRRCYSRL